MNITGIRPYESLAYKGIEQPNNELVNNSSQTLDRKNDSNDYEIIEARKRQTETSYDFARKFDPNATFSLKGSESDLASLDAPAKSRMITTDKSLNEFNRFVRADEIKKDVQTSLLKKELENFDIEF